MHSRSVLNSAAIARCTVVRLSCVSAISESSCNVRVGARPNEDISKNKQSQMRNGCENLEKMQIKYVRY